MYKVFGIALAALVIVSCQNSGNRKVANPAPATPATFNAPALPVTGSGQPATVNSTPATQVTPAPATPATTNSAAAVALNPAHGAPGHRCDIPVGAPLNSAAGNTAAPAAGSNPAPVMLQTPPPAPPTLSQPVNSNVRLNPAHGQPGHDCAIPVGQPLKS